MTRFRTKQDWLLLVHVLPPRPTSLRVRIWRKLQKLGAVAIKNSIYVLPFGDKTFEDFQWLKQEIESSGGEATVFRAGTVEGATDDEIVETFRHARDEEYSLVTAELDGLTGAIREQKRGGHLEESGRHKAFYSLPFSTGRLRSCEADLDRLHKELERIISIDFFQASGRAGAVVAYERCRETLLASQNRKQKVAATASKKDGSLHLAQFQGRHWITRKNLFIDRLASLWLIKRFIDRRPRFSFVSDGETVKGGIAFDMYGAEFAHQGEDCTFETMIKRFGLGDDRALGRIAEIVHDIDLKDNKFNRLEAPGLSAIIRGLADLLEDDRKLAAQCGPVFDGLYELFNKDEKKTGDTIGGKRTRRTGARKRHARRK
ncbi:MAG: chromate resistance protein [Blastocatellia bacterium]|nr:chromate resistance protein [Blastocatellia bacterium]